MTAGRFHLTLHAGARPVMHGWWGKRATADDKFRRWIGEHGSVDGARITLIDEQEQQLLKTWPDES
ncbi:hypothetical protein [Streptomyces sp. NPDC050564]|uniref:hypothetical protein n=1 Tax=Streptomyces sp. NPDC050564 TaxID=3365631 RepID=UPI0037B2B666